MADHTTDEEVASTSEVRLMSACTTTGQVKTDIKPCLSISRDLNNDMTEFLSDVSRSCENFNLKSGFYSADQGSLPSIHVNTEEIEDHHRNVDFPHITFGLAAIHHSRKHKKRRKMSKDKRHLSGSSSGDQKFATSQSYGSTTDTGAPSPVSQSGHEEGGSRSAFYIGEDGLNPEDMDGDADRSSGVCEYKIQRETLPKERHASQHSDKAAWPRNVDNKTELASAPHLAPDTEMLSDADVDDITTHRLAPFDGVYHRKVTKRKAKRRPIIQQTKPVYDHSPHQMFVELDELETGTHDTLAWHQRARWIEYEEDVEEGSHRWGRPHVACLSFHSLLELRKCLADGVILLDLEATDLLSIATAVVDQCVVNDLLDPSQKGRILGALLLKHRHVGESSFKKNLSYLDLHLRGSFRHHKRESIAAQKCRQRSLSEVEFCDVTKALKDNENLKNDFLNEIQKLREDKQYLDERRVPKAKTCLAETGDRTNIDHKSGQKHVRIDLQHLDNEEQVNQDKNPSISVVRKKQPEANIFKRIPKSAEATSVLVGDFDSLSKPVMAFVRLSEGQLLSNVTEVPVPVRFMFIVLGPSSANMDYYEIGRSISTLMADSDFSDIAYHAEGRKDLLDAINQFLDGSIVLPPGNLDKDTLLPILDMVVCRKEKTKPRKTTEQQKVTRPTDDPLTRTKRPFGGLIRDVKRRYSIYLSDIKDGLNLQCLATFFFIYFACLSPAITFGGLMSQSTDKYMGVSEMLIMVCISGMLMALLAGQPLVIVGATGPLLVFEENFFQVCQYLGLEYLPFRFWVCIWVTLLAILVVMFEGIFVIRYITRFLQEIFSALISLIFIYEVFRKLYYVFKTHPLVAYYPPPHNITSLMDFNQSHLFNLTLSGVDLDNVSLSSLMTSSSFAEAYDPTKNQPNTALLALILTFGTFLIAYVLKIFRNGKFLGRQIRRAIGDFGIPIAIIIMVLVDYLVKDTYTDKLDVPDGFTPTAPLKRGWLINPLGGTRPLPVWAYFAALIPAILVSILIFMETLITSLIINKPEKKLRKGSGYHLDLLLVGMFACLSGVFGLPLLCVATVRSVTHVSALMVYSTKQAPGKKPELIEVREQRLTGLMVHIMIGISVLLGPVLRQVPLAVLFGVFLYMGVASISGIQLFDRIQLLFMPVKHHPPVPYVRKVRMMKMHLYTLIQVLCLAVLWTIKSTKAALSFPFFLLILIPLRLKVLTFIFTEKELAYLDGDGEMEREDDEPDFCQQAVMPM